MDRTELKTVIRQLNKSEEFKNTGIKKLSTIDDTETLMKSFIGALFKMEDMKIDIPEDARNFYFAHEDELLDHYKPEESESNEPEPEDEQPEPESNDEAEPEAVPENEPENKEPETESEEKNEFIFLQVTDNIKEKKLDVETDSETEQENMLSSVLLDKLQKDYNCTVTSVCTFDGIIPAMERLVKSGMNKKKAAEFIENDSGGRIKKNKALNAYAYHLNPTSKTKPKAKTPIEKLRDLIKEQPDKIEQMTKWSKDQEIVIADVYKHWDEVLEAWRKLDEYLRSNFKEQTK